MRYSKKILEQVTNRKQRLVLNGRQSSWADIKAGVTQGLVIGPVSFFFLYINDVTENLDSNPKLFEQHKK